MAKLRIPFRWMPASWGLVGVAYLEAEAHYTLKGEALERRLLHIRLGDNPALNLELLELDHRYGHISDYDLAKRRIELTQEPSVDRDLALLDIELQFQKITDIDYQRQRAALKNEPWIAIIKSGFDPSQGVGVYLEFDWNSQWIELLRQHGFVGRNDEQVVDDWFTEVCRSHALGDPLVPYSLERD